MRTALVTILTRERGPVTSSVAVLLLLLSDLALGMHTVGSSLLSALQTLLVLPWAMQVFRLEPDERARSRLSRLRIVAVHLITLALVGICLVNKFWVLRYAHRYGASHYVDAYRTYSVGASVFFLVGLFARGSRLGRLLGASADHPARLMFVSFGLATTLGGFVLTLPQALVRIADASFVDGLFTAASAVCVTGLSVNEIARTYTFFGQAVILGLVQIGGLGIMVLSSFFALLAGTKLRVRSSAVLAEMIDAESLASIKRNVLAIVLYTLSLELVGAALLYGTLRAESTLPDSPGGLLWSAVFHAVSAFCNAGFSLYEGNWSPFVASYAPSLVLASLVLLGGLGFPVLDELARRFVARVRRRRPPRLSLHARVVLVTSASLLVGSTIALLLLESSASMRALSWPGRVHAAFFHAASLRSGGFAVVDFGAVRPATLAIACIVMFIGGSPGSSAGGIKTTTFATLVAAFRAEVRGERALRLFDRTLPEPVVRRAFGVTFFAVLLLAAMIVALLMVESAEPLALIFEAVSAFATVGLSTGITATLTVPGKLVLVFAMFVGRIGPMTFALALARRERALPYALPEERVSIG